jgi:hypothetical protein
VKARLRLASILCLIALCRFASAGPDFDPICIAKIGGFSATPASAIVILGDYAYLTEYTTGLHIIDIHNPAHPLRVGSLNLPGAYRIDIRSPYAFITGERGFDVIDISDPRNPALVGNYFNGSVYRGSIVVGNYAYALGAGIQRIDLSDLAHPLGAGAYQVYQHPTSITAVGKYFYVSDSSNYGLTAIIDPANIQLHVKVLSRGGYPSMVIRGNIAYMQSGYGLEVYDVSDPLTPILLKGPSDGAVTGSGPAFAGDYLVTLGKDSPSSLAQITVFEPRSNFTNYTACARYLEPGERASSFAVNNHYLYVLMASDNSSEFRVVDLFAPSALQRTAASYGPAESIALDGQLLYKINSSGLQLIDVSSTTPVVISELPEQRGAIFDVNENYACIAGRSNNIVVLDVSDPFHPSITAETQDDLTFRSDARIFAGKLYVTGRPSLGGPTLKIYNIAQGSLTLDGNYLGFGSISDPLPNGLVLKDKIAFILQPSGLLAVDVSNPFSRSIAGKFSFESERAFAIASSGKYAFVLTGTSVYEISRAHLVTIDLSNPAQLTQVASIPLRRSPSDITTYRSAISIVGNFAFIGGVGVQVVNISDPLNPKCIDANNTLTTWSVVANASHIFAVCDQLHQVVDFGPYPPAPAIRLHGVPLRDGESRRVIIQSRAPVNGRLQRASSLGSWTDWNAVSVSTDAVEIPDNDLTTGASFYLRRAVETYLFGCGV